jgi:hypothetical protein
MGELSSADLHDSHSEVKNSQKSLSKIQSYLDDSQLSISKKDEEEFEFSGMTNDHMTMSE